MCIVSFIGLDKDISEKDISRMVEYLNVTSILIKAGHISTVWCRWTKPGEISEDEIVEAFLRAVVERFALNSGCVKRGVSLPEDIIWNSDAEVYVVGTVSEIKGYIESYLRLDRGIRGEVCREDEFLAPFIYQIQAERKSENCVLVHDYGFLFKKDT